MRVHFLMFLTHFAHFGSYFLPILAILAQGSRVGAMPVDAQRKGALRRLAGKLNAIASRHNVTQCRRDSRLGAHVGCVWRRGETNARDPHGARTFAIF